MISCSQQVILPFVELFVFDHQPRQAPMMIQTEQVLGKIGLVHLLILL